ncbi:MAG: response regulator transcription factor [Anaerolineae bacterium]|nr:response regulator transcription factor [Anaerolineae bacterium]MBL6966092.1 response regulator transcription factor [Anaerolineales bacterium]
MIRVLIIDDHEIVRKGLRMTIQGESDLEFVGEGANGNEAIQLAESAQPDVILMDVKMPEIDGIQAAGAIHAAHPDIAILVLSSFGDDPELFAALQAGASGYLLKDISGDDLVKAIRGAATGKPQLHPKIARRLMQRMPAPENPLDALTAREADVLRCLARGMSNKEIAEELVVAETTVKGYVSTILGKLHLSDRTQAALLAVRYGLIEVDDLPDIPR